MPDKLILANARIVLATEIVTGAVTVADGKIAAIDTGRQVPAGAIDLEGDLLIPGLIELHTDNLERHIEPRPAAHWPHRPAIVAHDAELAACGITTVFDALRVGTLRSRQGTGYSAYARDLATEIMGLRTEGALKISHFLHLRAEICSQELVGELDSFGPRDRVGIVSLMDHTPGQRQFADPDKLKVYMTRKHGLTDAAFADYCDELRDLQVSHGARHEAAAVAAAGRYGAALASHDDTTEGQVRTSAAHGVRLAEFPTTEEAARACRDAGIAVMMGAPNLVRGGSHSGNVSAEALAKADLLDIVSSDYVPAALLLSAVILGRLWDDLPRGISTVTGAPAQAVGLADRGRIEAGLRADLVRLHRSGDLVLPRGVWSAGRRVA
ncbi:MAG: alpha-D-ribose 1-methylphosphonate 5-triphosphate diphosphatase [Jannaschia sp.]